MGGSKIELEPHIVPRLMPDKRNYHFQIPRTTPTYGLKKWLFEGAYEVRKGTYSLMNHGSWANWTNFWVPGKTVKFFGVKNVVPSSTLKMRKSIKKIVCVYAYTHTCTRKYVMVRGKYAPPPPPESNRVKAGDTIPWKMKVCITHVIKEIEFSLVITYKFQSQQTTFVVDAWASLATVTSKW